MDTPKCTVRLSYVVWPTGYVKLICYLGYFLVKNGFSVCIPCISRSICDQISKNKSENLVRLCNKAYKIVLTELMIKINMSIF